MTQPTAMVQSVHESAIREINALEQRIAASEDDADAKLWEQAEAVVKELDAGLSQRALAKAWINVRTGAPYDEKHVRVVREVWRTSADYNPRPRFRDAYNAVANRRAKEPDNEIPFSIWNAFGDLLSLAKKTVATWPDDRRREAPALLREVANRLEEDLS